MSLYVSFNACDSQVSPYTPFHFSFTVPLSNLTMNLLKNRQDIFEQSAVELQVDFLKGRI